MSQVPPPNLSDAHNPTLRSIAALFGRGLIYALAFCAVYRAMLFVYPAGGSYAEPDDALRKRQQSQMQGYDEQARRAGQMLEDSEKQQARSRALITKQEERAQRFDAILDRWEKQAGLRR